METRRPHPLLILAAFSTVYFVWGSTYLGIRLAIETIPPFTMAGLRFLSAGLVMLGWARIRGVERPSPPHWRSAWIVGWLLLGSNGLLSWAEQFVPSGIAALVIATVPMWMVGFESRRRGGSRPTAGVLAGLVLGVIGILVLVGPSGVGGQAMDPTGALVLLVSAAGWAFGSVYSKSAPATSSTIQNVGMQMFLGSLLLLAVGFVLGERLNPLDVSATSAWALLYLASVGGVVAYGAYLWLLQVSTPARVSTYAYVNPVVAILLGWSFAGEALSPRVLVAAVVVVAAVGLITTARSRRDLPASSPTPLSPNAPSPPDES